jgi:hypothetical protein
MKILYSIFLLAVSCVWGRQVQFNQEFAPHEGIIKFPEAKFRKEICLNGLWEFQGKDCPRDWKPNTGNAPALEAPAADKWETVKIKIPSPWNINSYKRSSGPDHHDFPSYPAEWEKYEMGWLRKTVKIPTDWQGLQILLHFEAVAGFAEVFVDDNKVGENFDLFLPFEADITSFAHAGQEIEVRVGIRKSSLFDDNKTVGRRVIPAGSMWGQHIVGIWQDVYLLALPKVRIQDVYVKPLVAEGVLELEVSLNNNSSQTMDLSLGGEIQEWKNQAGKGMLAAPVQKWTLGDKVLTIPTKQISVAADSRSSLTVSIPVDNKLRPWTPDSPHLYGVTLSVQSVGKQIDSKYQRFGWRQWTFADNKLCLNGQPIELRGDSWHFQGIPQMTRRYAWSWFTTIKEANGNAVRPHAQVYPSFYLEMADEMGICVLDETSNWASDGGPKFDLDAFWQASDTHLERLVLRDRNHPCVFGWSLTNENRPIIMHVFNRPDLMPVQVKAWDRWARMCRELDPTRPWISGDGDDDGNGTLPTVVGHYGDENGMKNWASKGKPWGVGEHSMAYYGTPAQVSKYNGPRAYESQLGRMEGLAYECYELISIQRRHGASYVSVFNIAWYALQPLELGLPDTSKPPTLNDGIFFTAPYVEGKPGVQPERIGPYSTTFNPGYDPLLPLYKPWPMFEAIKHANTPGGPAPSKWAEMPKSSKRQPATASIPYQSVMFIGQDASKLKDRLSSRGVKFNETPAEGNNLVIIDGQYSLTNQDAAKIKGMLDNGADVWIWGIVPETAAAFNAILPWPVELTQRKASSLLINTESPIVAGLDHSDFYFCEIQRTPAMEYGLQGAFVENGQVILAACDTDWTRWNKAEESVKTASVLRSEREAKPAGAAMVQCAAGKGRILINTMTQFYNTDRGNTVLRSLLGNAGVSLKNLEMDSSSGVFDIDGNLSQSLICGAFQADSPETAYQKDFLNGETSAKPKENDLCADRKWFLGKTVSEGTFDFNQMKLPGDKSNTAVYMSFWLWSPRPLDDLLIEPDMPKLDLIAGADDACKIWLNGKAIHERFAIHPLNVGDIQCRNLPLKQGWNHFLIKVAQGGGQWAFAARLNCSDYDFMTQLKAAVQNPDQQ